jgi:hypothetical protein
MVALVKTAALKRGNNEHATFRHIKATSLHRKNYGAEYIFKQNDEQ